MTRSVQFYGIRGFPKRNQLCYRGSWTRQKGHGSITLNNRPKTLRRVQKNRKTGTRFVQSRNLWRTCDVRFPRKKFHLCVFVVGGRVIERSNREAISEETQRSLREPFVSRACPVLSHHAMRDELPRRRSPRPSFLLLDRVVDHRQQGWLVDVSVIDRHLPAGLLFDAPPRSARLGSVFQTGAIE